MRPGIPNPRSRGTLLALLALCLGGVSLRAQQFDELAGRGLPRELDNVLVLALRDFDRDGHLDLLYGDDGLYPGRPLQMLLGGPDGLFRHAPAGRVANVPALASEIVCADFDGDGDIDVFVANRDLRQNLLLLNDGTGRLVDFTATHLPLANDDSRAAACADVDRDGDLDLAVANVLGADTLLINDGTGRFTPGAAMPDLASDDPSTMAFIDGDGDGYPDLFVGNARGQDRYWRNDGSPRFFDVTASVLPVDSDPSTHVVVFDANRDGAPDLAVANRDRPNRLLRNDGIGRFASDPTWMPTAAGPSVDIDVLDADRDGDDDLVIGQWGSPNLLLLNDGTGSFVIANSPWVATPRYTNVLAVGDVDNDGDVDIVGGSGRSIYALGRKELLLNDGHGSFVSATQVPWESTQSSSSAIGTCDIDGDGVRDVVVAIGSDVETWFGDGVGGIDGRRLSRTGVGPDFVQALASGDVDRDGDEDLLVGTSSSNVLLRNDGAGNLVADPAAVPPGGMDTRAILLIDVDGDGDLDVVEGNAGSSPEFAQPNRILMNDGTGTFTDETAVRLAIPPDFTFAIAQGDVDGDGDIDLVFGNWSVRVPTAPRQPNRLVLNDGTGRFIDAPAGRLPIDDDPTASLVLGDLDGDGDLDLLVGNMNVPSRLFRNDGTGTFALDIVRMPTVITPARSVLLADTDDDGDLDVVIGNDDWVNGYLRNDGPAGLVIATSSAWRAVRDATTGIAVADFDGDGDPDVVVANRATQQDFLLANLGRHVDVPLPLRIGRSCDVDVFGRTASPPTNALLWASPFLGTPLSLMPIGVFRLDGAALIGFGSLPFPAATGVTTFRFVMPPTTNLVGAPVFFQALVYDSANLSTARLTNVAARVIGS